MNEQKYTYNSVFNQYGEEAMLAYESLVERFINNNQDSKDAKPEILRLAASVENLAIAQDLLEQAKKHAVQEIEESEAHDVEGPISKKKILVKVYEQDNSINIVGAIVSSMEELQKIIEKYDDSFCVVRVQFLQSAVNF